MSRNVKTRLKAHQYDKPHDSVRIMGGFNRGDAYRYETRWINRFKPKYNKGWLNNAGRKALPEPSDKVILVGFYVKKSVVDSVGGMDMARLIVKNYLESRAEADEVGRMAMHG